MPQVLTRHEISCETATNNDAGLQIAEFWILLIIRLSSAFLFFFPSFVNVSLACFEHIRSTNGVGEFNHSNFRTYLCPCQEENQANAHLNAKIVNKPLQHMYLFKI